MSDDEEFPPLTFLIRALAVATFFLSMLAFEQLNPWPEGAGLRLIALAAVLWWLGGLVKRWEQADPPPPQGGGRG